MINFIICDDNEFFLMEIYNVVSNFCLSKKINFKILAIDNFTIIVEWYLEQNEEIYDGIYEIKFNNNLEILLRVALYL